MRLVELDPKFMLYELITDTWDTVDGKVTGPRQVMHKVDSIDQAQGVRFLCPKCFVEKCGRIGTHSILCWSSSRGVPADAEPGPGRWKMSGTCFDDLTLSGDDGKSDSILLTSGCAAHFFVKNGLIC